MSDDHSRIARLEEGIKSVCHTLDEIKQAAQRREQKMDSSKYTLTVSADGIKAENTAEKQKTTER